MSWRARSAKSIAEASTQVEALRGVDVEIATGELVAIMGPSGCGKTTLLHCLSGLDDFDEGEVLLAGTRLGGLSDGRKTDLRARQTGFVFQGYNLLPVLSARENVELPLLLTGPAVARPAVKRLAALAEVGLVDRAEHRPSALSGGQQQRVAIARALVHQPAVVWADEPTGNLDSDATAEIMALFNRLHRERRQTFVVVTHSREVAAHAERILRMRDGRIVADERVVGPGPSQRSL